MLHEVARGLLVLALLSARAAPAGAQVDEGSAGETAERRAIDTQIYVSVGLHAASSVFVVGGGFAILWGAFGLTAEGGNETEEMATFVGGFVSVPIGVILFAVALGLDIDAAIRFHALPRAVSFGPGPGELGLSLAYDF